MFCHFIASMKTKITQAVFSTKGVLCCKHRSCILSLPNWSCNTASTLFKPPKNYCLNTRVAWYWNPPISLLNIHQYQLTAALLFSSMASQNCWFINQFFRYLKLFFFHFQPTPNRWPSMRCTTSRAPPTAPSTAAGLPTVSQKNFFKKLFHTLVPFRRSGSSRIKDTHLLGNFFR